MSVHLIHVAGLEPGDVVTMPRYGRVPVLRTERAGDGLTRVVFLGTQACVTRGLVLPDEARVELHERPS